MTEIQSPEAEPEETTPPLLEDEEEQESSISGLGCLGVIVSSIVFSVVLYVFVMSRNEDTRGPAYMAASTLFGFFVVGIIWGVIQQQRESDASRAAEEVEVTAPGGDPDQ